ncbi:hypothetical protein [Agitococcus lubricus]|uniref:Uncharacterized protein n=1 Tax=Agitococcus lubricus TaxID=1077255 RepID=A0A2T5J0C3_9GAMM|nr:hypothetical protein [Agitococcus lubricus]PTQ89798.1 hypothetical protein C8N29_105125 [Agitococcus lubricus]
MNLKAAIFATIGAAIAEAVAVPEFGMGLELKVSVMTVAERANFDEAYRLIKESERAINFRPLLLVFTVKDENGQAVFSVDDVEQIKQLNSLAVVRLSDVALRLNKMLKDDVEAHEKNS